MCVLRSGRLSELLGFAHKSYVLTTEDRKAQKLFSSPEEAITFAEDYGFDEAHVELLHTSGMIFESAEVLVKGDRIVDAVKTLIATPRAPDRTRRAIEYLSSGLWQRQAFGMDHPTTDPGVVSELLKLADTLKRDIREPEAQDVGLSFSYDAALTLENHRSQCSKQDTKPILKHSALCTPSSSGPKITPLRCCASIPSSPPLCPPKALQLSTIGLTFSSISPTSNF